MDELQLEKIPVAAKFVASKQGLELQEIWTEQHRTLHKIHVILQDGEWHTAEQIGECINRSKDHIQKLLSKSKESWNVESRGGRGYRVKPTRDSRES